MDNQRHQFSLHLKRLTHANKHKLTSKRPHNMPESQFKVLTNANENSHHILRRGIDSGFVQLGNRLSQLASATELWGNNQPAFLPQTLSDELKQYAPQIAQSRRLYEAVLDETEVEEILDEAPYPALLGERFQILSSRFDEADDQEIISVDFDVMDGDTLLMEDIWMRVSWLSFHEEDESMRFRVSFGMENFDDVSEDPERQLAAAELSQCIFPESALITENEKLISLLSETLNIEKFNFVERIVYFNADNGGAQFHHDAEKGHLGVVYAQVTGETFWLALSRTQLINEINVFMSAENNLSELKSIFNNDDTFDTFCESIKQNLSDMLNDPGNEEISSLLNESKHFFDQLVTAGHAFYLTAGDVILLPQESMDECAWHSVFCIGEDAGEALSFAIKPA